MFVFRRELKRNLKTIFQNEINLSYSEIIETKMVLNFFIFCEEQRYLSS